MPTRQEVLSQRDNLWKYVEECGGRPHVVRVVEVDATPLLEIEVIRFPKNFVERMNNPLDNKCSENIINTSFRGVPVRYVNLGLPERKERRVIEQAERARREAQPS